MRYRVEVEGRLINEYDTFTAAEGNVRLWEYLTEGSPDAPQAVIVDLGPAAPEPKQDDETMLFEIVEADGDVSRPCTEYEADVWLRLSAMAWEIDPEKYPRPYKRLHRPERDG